MEGAENSSECNSSPPLPQMSDTPEARSWMVKGRHLALQSYRRARHAEGDSEGRDTGSLTDLAKTHTGMQSRHRWKRQRISAGKVP